jgi:hypothetical protein
LRQKEIRPNAPLNLADIEKAKKQITSQGMARLIGVTCHLIYWLVFGHVNPKQIEFNTKR